MSLIQSIKQLFHPTPPVQPQPGEMWIYKERRNPNPFYPYPSELDMCVIVEIREGWVKFNSPYEIHPGWGLPGMVHYMPMDEFLSIYRFWGKTFEAWVAYTASTEEH
jgi:hypothetical protein